MANLKLWLERSGAVPLHLYLDFRTHYVSRYARDTVEISICPHLLRIHELVICAPRTISNVSSKRLIPPGDSAKLKRLEIILSKPAQLEPSPFPIRLESFALRHGDTAVDTKFLVKSIIPDHLVELDLTNSDYHTGPLVSFLTKCTALRALKIDSSWSEPHTHPTLEALQYLEINSTNRVPYIGFYAPNLIHLKFDTYRTLVDWWPLTPKIWWPLMPKLHIFTFTLRQEQLHLSKLPPTIIDLRIYAVKWTSPLSTIIAQLVPQYNDRDPARPLPHLAYLRIRVQPYDSGEQLLLSSLLRSLLIARPLLHLHLMLATTKPSLFHTFREELHRTFGERVECDDAGPPDLRRWFSPGEFTPIG